MFTFGPPNILKLAQKHNVRGLIKALQYKKESSIQESAAKALGEIGDPRAAKPLLALLFAPKLNNYKVNTTIIEALRKIGDADAHTIELLITEAEKPVGTATGIHEPITKEEASEILLRALEGNDKSVWSRLALPCFGAKAMIRALRDNSSKVVVLLKKQSDFIRKNNSISPDHEKKLTSAFRTSHVITGWLVAIGEPAVQPLIAALEDKNEYVRWSVTEALGQIGDRRAIEPLTAVLKDSEEDVRKAAATALRNYGVKV